MEIEVFGTVHTKVHVKPSHVIVKLIEKELGFRSWILERDGKYYQVHEESAGHNIETEAEITKEKFDYVKALELVLEKLRKDDKK